MMSEFTKDTSSSTSSSFMEGNSALLALESLDKIDDCALDTADELENIPHADFSKLQHLSEQYFETCEKVKTDIKQNTNLIQPYSPFGHSNYALKKRVELAEAQQALASEKEGAS